MGIFTPLTAIPRLLLAKKQKKAADAINPVDTNNADDPLIQEQQQMARVGLNSGMAGAGQYRRSIFQNLADTNASARRNSVSGAQAISVAAAMNGQTNKALAGLQTAEAQDKERKQGVLSNVLATQGNMNYRDRLRRFMTARQDKARLMNASLQNKGQVLNDFDDTLGSIAGIFAGGGPR